MDNTDEERFFYMTDEEWDKLVALASCDPDNPQMLCADCPVEDLCQMLYGIRSQDAQSL